MISNHQKLKHSWNFDKKQKSKTHFLSIKVYIQLTHARSHFGIYFKNGFLQVQAE